VQISGADDLMDDPEVLLGRFAGRPTGETDSGGLVVVDGGVSVDEDGVARALSDATLAGGVYSAVLADGTLTIGDYTLESAVGVPVAGGADLGYTTGMLGLAIPLQSLLDLAASLGVDTSSLDALAALSDIDTDGDGVPDAVSAAFLYEGPGCVVAGG